jgi:serine/threonine protein kinase
MTSDSSQIPPENQADTWSEVQATFESARKLEGRGRELFLVERCGNNAELRREVEALLEDHDETLDLLENPLSPSTPPRKTESPLPAGADGPLIGTRIGAYRLEREIGQGGMGAVYLATRADSEFDKRVAIKLIRAGLESDFAIRRFRHQRQILARLENPYIARLIDGGTTAAGAPYFVMEYVEGQSVTQYCEAHSLTARDRVTLFLKICSAVQYAHERNIIHRDLKPGNILVKRKGTPKLLDFGIAKILSEDSPALQEATLQGLRMLTPAYASPEQMHGDPATVRSDILVWPS